MKTSSGCTGGDFEDETASFTATGHCTKLAPEQPSEPPRDGKSEAESASVFFCLGHVDVEDPLDIARQDPGAIVLDPVHHTFVTRRDADLHGTLPGSVLDRVPEQIDQDLFDAAGIGCAVRQLGGRYETKINPLLIRRGCHAGVRAPGD